MVKDILAHKGSDVVTVERGETVLGAALRMSARRIGALLVMEGERAVGIVTERDILDRVVARQRDPVTTGIGEIMTQDVVVCTPDTQLDECKRIMTERRIRHLPVVDGGRIAGMVTIGDLIAAETRAQQARIEDLEQTVGYLKDYLYGYQ